MTEHHHHEDSPLVEKERRRGTELAVLLIAVLIGIVLLFLFAGELFEEAPVEPVEETNIAVEVEPGEGVEVKPAPVD